MLKDDPGCKFFKNVNKLYSMQSSHFLMVCYLISSNLVLCILDILLSHCTLCNNYSIHVLLLAESTFAAFSAQECETIRCSGGFTTNLKPGALPCCCLQVHDIEDLAKVGRDHKACPYYAATHFAGGSL